MAPLQDIKRRIRSVRNTRKITKAMELVAGARLRRAEARIVQMRDYADRMQELTAGTARAAASLRGLTLLQRREPGTVAIVPLTGDRGLAGAFNAQILRRAIALSTGLRDEGKSAGWRFLPTTSQRPLLPWSRSPVESAIARRRICALNAPASPRSPVSGTIATVPGSRRCRSVSPRNDAAARAVPAVRSCM